MVWNKYVDGVAPHKEYFFDINGNKFRGNHNGKGWCLYKIANSEWESERLIASELKSKKHLLVEIRNFTGIITGDILITDREGKKQRNF
jgi:hypothetical protein